MFVIVDTDCAAGVTGATLVVISGRDKVVPYTGALATDRPRVMAGGANPVRCGCNLLVLGGIMADS